MQSVIDDIMGVDSSEAYHSHRDLTLYYINMVYRIWNGNKKVVILNCYTIYLTQKNMINMFIERVGLCGSIMQKYNLQVMSFTRKSRKYSSYKGRIGTVAPNRIKRRFNTHIPHQKITTDTTEFKYYEVDSKGKMTMHKLYLDPFMDMFNGEIISYGIDKRPSAANVMNALNEAIEVTSDCPFRRTFHSDQGWAYQMKAYSHRLREEKIFQSMSRKGNCLDNSVMENFFGLLKQEIYHGTVYYSYEELKTEIEKYIRYYNEKRIKEKLGWLSPVQYRLSLLVA